MWHIVRGIELQFKAIYWVNLRRVDVFKKDYCFNQLELVGFENNIHGKVFLSRLAIHSKEF